MRPRWRRAVLGSGAVLELTEGGLAGSRTALALHGEDGPSSMAATVDHLRIAHQVVAPTHPGWAGTERAASLNGVGALVRAYLDLLAETDARDVVVVGASFGAWVAARMAVDDVQGRLGALVLIGPIGLRVPGQTVPAPAAAWVRGVVDGRGPVAPGSEVLGAYAGPVAHDPALIAQLGAVDLPALVVWGAKDHTPLAYGRAWADALGCARLVVVPGAGYLPSRQAPEATFAAIDTFLSPPPLVLTA